MFGIIQENTNRMNKRLIVLIGSEKKVRVQGVGLKILRPIKKN